MDQATEESSVGSGSINGSLGKQRSERGLSKGPRTLHHPWGGGSARESVEASLIPAAGTMGPHLPSPPGEARRLVFRTPSPTCGDRWLSGPGPSLGQMEPLGLWALTSNIIAATSGQLGQH